MSLRIAFSRPSSLHHFQPTLPQLQALRNIFYAHRPSPTVPSFSISHRQRPFHSCRPLSSSPSPVQSASNPHRDFYKTHGRALFKALTLAFFTYQVVYWAWLTLETEEIMDQKNREIKSLESEARLLDEGRRSHLPAGAEKLGMGKVGKEA